MPYKLHQSGDRWQVIAKDTGRVVGTHTTRRKAVAQIRALYANVKDAKKR